MIFSLDILRARKGDCFLLHFGDEMKRGLALIDGGPGDVYGPYLKPRLEHIRSVRKLDDDRPLPVNLLMVSHVDDDHIRGILDLTREERERRDAGQATLLRVQSFWHNSFDAVAGNETGAVESCMRGHFGEAAVTGHAELPDDARAEVELESEERPVVLDSGLRVLASIAQGHQLRGDAEVLGWKNQEFGTELIVADEGGGPRSLVTHDGITFTIAGPMQPEVEALREKHAAWVASLEAAGKPVPSALAAYVDKSVPNLSSIVALAEAGGKRILLTGDARGDKVLEGLQLAGLLEPGDDSIIEVDLLKVPHHGSANNLNDDFFDRIVARHYVFTGNGEHGNPEREAFEMLWRARGNADYEVHLSYPVKTLDVERKKDWEKERAKELKKKAMKPGTKVRAAWSPKKHSLQAFLDAHTAFAEKVNTVPEEGPYVIDLLDPLGY